MIFNDYACPDVVLAFSEISQDPSAGTIISYTATIAGSFGSFEIQFGDGHSSTQPTGSYTYAPNAIIDPVVIVENGDCQIIQTPMQRNGSAFSPKAKIKVPPFAVPIPIPPNFVTPSIPSNVFPCLDVTIPPIIFPCLDLTSLSTIASITIPSIVINFPSIISFATLTIPSLVIAFSSPIPSVISFANVPSFTPIQFAAPPSFTPIQFGPSPLPSVISFMAISLIFGPVQFGPIPSLGPIHFDTPPSFSPIPFAQVPSFGLISFAQVPSFSPIPFGAVPSFPQIQFGTVPSFGLISFAQVPSFPQIQFGTVPSFSPIPFGAVPSFPQIQFGPSPLPSIISFGPSPLPSIISFATPPTFTPIKFADVPSFALIQFAVPPTFSLINFNVPPLVSIFWGTPPVVSCTCRVVCPSSSGGSPALMAARNNNFAFADAVNPNFEEIELQYDMVGFPSEIKIVAPDKIEPIQVQHDIPQFISLHMPHSISVDFPNNKIEVIQPKWEPIQHVVTLKKPKAIDIRVPENVYIPVKFPEEMPKVAFDFTGFPQSIPVTGIPQSIDVRMPSFVDLRVPEGLKVPLVFEGPPLSAELKINWNLEKLMQESEDLPCFRIIPCK